MSDIQLLHQAARELWEAYLTCGPSKLSPDAMEPFIAQKNALPTASDDDATELHALLEELEPLLRRCAERPEGLCFVSGEAGLIPRRDLHEKCEELLDRLQSLTQRQ